MGSFRPAVWCYDRSKKGDLLAYGSRLVKKAKAKDKQQKLADSSELYLLIHPNGSKC